MKRTKILIADDDQITLTVLSKGLRDAGYQVLCATNGREAVQIGRRERPDLAVLDIRMPGVFGIEAARQLRTQANVDSIFLSAHADTVLVQLASKEGALGYLVKPVEVKQLIPAIEAALERSAELRHLHRTEASLTDALKSNREIAVAIGVYMERFSVSKQEAFESLRSFARSRRVKMQDLAGELTREGEEKDALFEEIHHMPL